MDGRWRLIYKLLGTYQLRWTFTLIHVFIYLITILFF